jgi:hypothetical protein
VTKNNSKDLQISEEQYFSENICKFTYYKIMTEAFEIQKEFQSRVCHDDFLAKRPIYTPDLFVETMKAFYNFSQKLK